MEQARTLSEGPRESFEAFLPFAKELEKSCSGCAQHVKRVELTTIAYRMMKKLHIRPGNLKDMQVTDFNMTTREIFIPNWKQSKDGIHLPLREEVIHIALEALRLSPNDFLFHRCVAKHLTEALREAEVNFDWPRGLVFTVHCLRHTGMFNQVGKIEKAVKALVSSVTGDTFDHYAESLQKRVRRT